MSSDLMDRYLDFVRSQGMMPGNKDSLELLKNKLGRNSLNVNRDFKDVKKSLVKTLETKKDDLNKCKNQLAEGVRNLNELNEFVDDPDHKGNDEKTSSYPVGYELKKDNIYDLLKNYLDDGDSTDIKIVQT